MDESLRCPRCADQPLAPDAEDAETLLCAVCRGSLIAASLVPEDFRTAAAAASSEALPETAVSDSAAASDLVCPACGGTMAAVPLDDAAFLCAGCGRGWFDGVTSDEAASAGVETPEHSASRLSRYLLYSFTLPERVLRSAVGSTAGLARETAEFLVPQAFQNSKTYEVVIRNSLKFLAQDVGGVAGDPKEAELGRDFAARKAVGNFVDLAGWATLAVSPVWMMAIVSDVAYGTKTYLHELAGELQKRGMIDETSTIHNVDDLLASVRETSGHAASLVDTPPLSIEQLKQTLASTRKSLGGMDVRKVLPESELRRYWQEMREIAARENVSFIGVSGAVTMHTLGKIGGVARGTLTGVQVAGGLVNRNVVGHYVNAMKDIRRKGFFQTVRETSGPYVEAVWNNFAVDRPTWTAELLSGRALGRAWTTVRGWLSRKRPPEAEAPAGNAQ